MQSIDLANTGRTTSRLGYGCSSLMGALNWKDSIHLLEAAYESGIRHFDVAPMYGYGEAEGCLGEFLARHRADVTVASKFGLLPAKSSTMARTARRMAGRLLRHLPTLKQRLAPASDVIQGAGERVRFDVPSARRSLESSLCNLRSERIDLWLLHEAEALDLCDDALLRFLEDSCSTGKIGAFGVGSEARKIPPLIAEHPAYCRVLQYEWSLFDSPVIANTGFRIHHRSLSTHFPTLRKGLNANESRVQEWSRLVGLDLRREGPLAALMLKASLEMNSASIILFSAKSVAKIHANVRTEEDASLKAPALLFRTLIRAEAMIAN